MVYSEYTQLDEFSSIMFMFIHYLTSSVRALFHIRPATPGHLGWGLGNGLCPISVKKPLITETRHTYKAMYTFQDHVYQVTYRVGITRKFAWEFFGVSTFLVLEFYFGRRPED